MLTRWMLALFVCCVVTTAHAQGESDRTAITQAALDYIEGWYTGDAERMERALHPELVKRMVFSDAQTGHPRLDHQSALTLVQSTRAGYGRNVPEDQRISDVIVLDVYEGAASVKVIASGWIDYLHLARWDGSWKIVNVLWELTPSSE